MHDEWKGVVNCLVISCHLQYLPAFERLFCKFVQLSAELADDAELVFVFGLDFPTCSSTLCRTSETVSDLCPAIRAVLGKLGEPTRIYHISAHRLC